MASSTVVNSRPTSVYLEDDEDYKHVPDATKAETRGVLYEFLLERAEHDDNITHEDRISIHESTVECIRNETTQTSTPVEECALTRIVKLLQDHGDDFQKRIDEDDILQNASDKAIEENDSGFNRLSQITKHMQTVISGLFEVDQNGDPQNVTLGKISAVFYYCYSICKKFVSTILPRNSMVAFLFSMGTSLIAYLAKMKFYDWINSHGGWLQALISLLPSNSWIQTSYSTNTLFLAGGIAMIGIWGYNRFIRQ